MAEPSAPAAVVPAAPAGGEDEDGVFGWFSDLQLENIDAESFGDCPLFMDEKDLQKPENAPMVEWLSSLQYDGMDPLELALELKERANKALKGQPVQAGAAATKPNPRLAITIYDDALCQKCGDSALEAVIWANRAQAHFKLRNWGHVMHDCVRSIRLNKAAVKPYWRGAQAALKLKKFTECLEFCSEGQKVEPANAELQEIAAKATAGRAELEAEVAERDAEEKEVARVQGMMRQLLELRKVQLRPRPEWLDGTYHLDLPTNEQVYVDEASCLHWAVRAGPGRAHPGAGRVSVPGARAERSGAGRARGLPID